MATPPLDGTVLITGASSGIGRELAIELGRTARSLILVARRRDRLDELAVMLRERRPALEVYVEACDLQERGAVDAMLHRLEATVGVIDVLVNNAGFGDMSVFDHADWDKTERMITLNVTSLLYLTHRLVRGMVERRRGGILNISSGFGMSFAPGMSTYVGTKHFVTGFTEVLRLDLAGTGVAVTQVCPGPVKTEFGDLIGNPTGMDPPALVEISAEACASEAVWAFRNGRAMVVPGLLMKIIMFIAVWTPRWLVRLVMQPLATALRRKQLGR